MRLEVLKHGHGSLQKMQPVLMMSYRRNFFGKHLARCLQEGLRHGCEWSVGELETFAAFVSSLNRCRF